jgi:four helix bundle protein
MGVHRFTELRAWQVWDTYKKAIYRLCASGPLARDVERRGQFERSAGRPCAHLAEGFGRFSPPDFARYCVIARSSLMESQNHLLDIVGRGHLTHEVRLEYNAMAEAALQELTGLMEYLQSPEALRNARRARERRMRTVRIENRTGNRTENRTRKLKTNREASTRKSERRLVPLLSLPDFPSPPFVRAGSCRRSAIGALDATHLDFGRRGFGCEVFVESSRVGFLDVRIHHAADDDGLMAAEAAADANLVAFSNGAVRLRALAIHLHLAAFAGAFRFRARLEQTRYVKPDVETYVVHPSPSHFSVRLQLRGSVPTAFSSNRERTSNVESNNEAEDELRRRRGSMNNVK